MHILYPSSPLSAKQPDEQFLPEIEAVREIGFGVSVFSFENFQSGDFRPFPPLPTDTEILYRGWMQSSSEYEAFVSALSQIGTRPAIDLQAYLASHYLPNWYSLLSDLTPETHIFPPTANLEAELRALAWPEFFIKDYVKSLKTSTGSRITKPDQVTAVVAEMRRFRGTVEGGFCVRRVESFLKETEKRYFVIEGVPYAATGDVPSIVNECVKQLKNRFYSVDVIQREDAQFRLVEIGDGQVSDLVGWSPEQFSRVLAKHFLN